MYTFFANTQFQTVPNDHATAARCMPDHSSFINISFSVIPPVSSTTPTAYGYPFHGSSNSHLAFLPPPPMTARRFLCARTSFLLYDLSPVQRHFECAARSFDSSAPHFFYFLVSFLLRVRSFRVMRRKCRFPFLAKDSLPVLRRSCGHSPKRTEVLRVYPPSLWFKRPKAFFCHQKS